VLCASEEPEAELAGNVGLTRPTSAAPLRAAWRVATVAEEEPRSPQMQEEPMSPQMGFPEAVSPHTPASSRQPLTEGRAPGPGQRPRTGGSVSEASAWQGDLLASTAPACGLDFSPTGGVPKGPCFELSGLRTSFPSLPALRMCTPERHHLSQGGAATRPPSAQSSTTRLPPLPSMPKSHSAFMAEDQRLSPVHRARPRAAPSFRSALVRPQDRRLVRSSSQPSASAAIQPPVSMSSKMRSFLGRFRRTRSVVGL